MSNPHPKSIIPCSEHPVKAKLPSGELISFYEYVMPADNDCGYHALGVSRAEAAQLLSDNILDEEIRKYIGSEIFAMILSRDPSVFTDKIMDSRYGVAISKLLDSWDKMQSRLEQEAIEIRRKIRTHEINGLSEGDRNICLNTNPEEWPSSAKVWVQSQINDIDSIRMKLEKYCQNMFMCLEYIKYYIAQPKNWLNFLFCISGKKLYSSGDAIGKIKKFNIRVWKEEHVLREGDQPVLSVKHEMIFDSTFPTINLKLANSHYNLLSTNPNLNRHPVMTAPYELLEDIKNQKEKKQDGSEKCVQFDNIIDNLRLVSNLNDDFLKELIVVLETMYRDNFKIVSQVIQTKKLKELQECFQQRLRDFQNNRPDVRIEEVFKAKSELSLYEGCLNKVYQLFHQILQTKTSHEKENIRRSLHNGFNRAVLGLESNSKGLFESPKTVFETRRIRFNKNGIEHEALQVVIYSEILGNRSLIYKDNIILGQNDVNLPLPNNSIIVSKEGTLKIGKCENNNHLVFRLDDHDIDFYDELYFPGSIDIQSAKACNIIGKVEARGGFRVKAEKFHLTGKPGEEGKLITQCFAAETRLFTNRGSISGFEPDTILSNQLITINSETFDNRGGRLFANSATIRFKDGKNDKGAIYTDKDLECGIEALLDNGQGTIWSERGNIHFYEKTQAYLPPNSTENPTGSLITSKKVIPNVMLINRDNGEIRAAKGNINCNINHITNEKGGLFESNTASFSRIDNTGSGTINHGSIQTACGCCFHRSLINNGVVNNGHGLLFFDVKDLELNSSASTGGGVTCGGSIITSPLGSFKYTNDAIYAKEYFKLNILHSQKLVHNISMPGFIDIIVHGGKLSNHAIIQSILGIQILTAWEWGEEHSIENFGGLIATHGDIVLQGKGILHTADGHGIYADNGKIITNCTNQATLTGRTNGKIIELTAKDVYTTALSATQDIVTNARHATFNGYSLAGRDTIASAQDTINVLGRLESGRNTVLSASNSITTAASASLKSGDSTQLVSNEIYLNSTTEVKRRLDIFGMNAVAINGETFSEEDIYIRTKTFIPKAPIRAGNKVELDVDKILGKEVDITAKKVILKENVEMLHCELEIEGDKMVIRPLSTKMEMPTPEEMEQQQRQIEELLEEMRQQAERQKKQKKKAKKKIIIKSVLGTAASVGLSAFLGPQMVLIFSKMSITGMAATLGTMVGEGMIMNGVNAAVMGTKVLKNAIKGGALSLLGSMGKELAVHAYDAARHRHPSLKTLAVNLASSAVGTAASNIGFSGAAASNQNMKAVKNVASNVNNVNVVKEIASNMGNALMRTSAELGTKLALDKNLRKSENLGVTAIATVSSAITVSLIQQVARTLEESLSQQGHQPEIDQEKQGKGNQEAKRKGEQKKKQEELGQKQNSQEKGIQTQKSQDVRVQEQKKNAEKETYLEKRSQENSIHAPSNELPPNEVPSSKNNFEPLLFAGSKLGSKTRIGKDKNGHTRYNDEASGQYSKSPLERAAGEKEAKFKVKDPSVKASNVKFTKKWDLLQRKAIVSNKNCSVTAGATAYVAGQGAISVSQGKNQPSIHATGVLAMGINVLDVQVNSKKLGEGQIQLDVLSAQGDGIASVDINNPGRRSAELTGNLRGSTVAVKAKYDTPKIPLPFVDSTIQCNFEMTAAHGVNISAGAGYSDYKTKPGGSETLRAGKLLGPNLTVNRACVVQPSDEQLFNNSPSESPIFDGYFPIATKLSPFSIG